jgi:hypothetical protein
MENLILCLIPRSQQTNACRKTMWLSAFAMAAVTITLVGCGKGNGSRGTPYPAEGQITWNKAPLAGAQVVLYPQGLPDAKAVPSRAQTGSDGRFRVSTFGAEDGAPEGEYAVTVVRYPMQKDGSGWVPGPNDLPVKYASPKKTDLRVKITSGDNKLPTLALQSPDKKNQVSRTFSLR